jgi:hypothetical protein
MTAQTSTAPTKASKFDVFTFTFGIAFAILYTICVWRNWPLFTYHPAVNRFDLFWNPGRSGEGPAMHWYGWLVVSAAGASVLGWIATIIPSQWLHRATIFCCLLAALWPAFFVLAVFIADRASVDLEFLRSVWITAVPALTGAIALGSFVSSQLAKRLWPRWLVIVPIGSFIVLGYSLVPLFRR